MYQIVTIRLLDFYLVEDVDSRDAENEGVILDFAVQMAAAGHILACRWSQMPPQS